MNKKNSFTKEELIDCAETKLFGKGNAQLPMPPMLMLDRIMSITDDGGKYGNGEIIAELDINPDLWFFDCHFIGDPVMPGCLGLDAMWHLGAGEVKFTGQVLPTAKKVTYRIDIKRVMMRKLVLGIADATMKVDGKTIYTAKDLRVGLFTDTDTL